MSFVFLTGYPFKSVIPNLKLKLLATLSFFPQKVLPYFKKKEKKKKENSISFNLVMLIIYKFYTREKVIIKIKIM